VSITLTEKTVNDTQVYIADVYLDDPSKLLSGLANDSFGRNVSETSSSIAQRVGAVLAINGDYYGFRDSGYVMRNGYLYRSTGEAGNEDLVIYEDGTFEIIDEGDVSAEGLEENGAVQIYSFGPGLVKDGEISVSEGEEVGQAMQSNPRTAIGMLEKGHYVFVVSDGRTSESEGLTLYEMAELMDELGCSQAYNLDGGGSTTMVWNGTVVNKPTTNGRSIKERSVSDVIYISGN
nr:phosphodiester glycosidase family protein [Lachnospiraceae bacterium]